MLCNVALPTGIGVVEAPMRNSSCGFLKRVPQRFREGNTATSVYRQGAEVARIPRSYSSLLSTLGSSLPPNYFSVCIHNPTWTGSSHGLQVKWSTHGHSFTCNVFSSSSAAIAGREAPKSPVPTALLWYSISGPGPAVVPSTLTEITLERRDFFSF